MAPCWLPRNRDDHSTAGWLTGFDSDRAAMQFDDPSSNRQSESDPTVSRRTSWIGAVEALKHPLHLLGCDPWATILDLETERSSVSARSQVDGSVRR